MRGLYAIIDYGVLKERIYPITEQIVTAGIKIIQFRAKNITDKELVTHALKLRCLTQSITFIINNRVDIALIVEADGVHLGQDDLPLTLVRDLLKNKIIGVTVRNLEQAILATNLGADYLSVGPIYSTTTKELQVPPLGIEIIREIKKNVSIPVIAIGGINEENIEEVFKAGADGIATASALGKGKNGKLPPIILITQRLFENME